jgi:hypothetical protein
MRNFNIFSLAFCRLTEVEVARLGHWALSHMFLSYLTGIPHEALLVMGTFPPLKRAYHVPRFHMDVPGVLPIIFEKADKQLEGVVWVSFANSLYETLRRADCAAVLNEAFHGGSDG